mgnify:FL=1
MPLPRSSPFLSPRAFRRANASPRHRNSPLEDKKVLEHVKTSRSLGLRADLTPFEWGRILDEFGNRCALSFSFLISMDHFIPQSIGHGGTYVGNVYPLDPDLNASKGDSNPYLWAEANKDKIDYPLFERLCEYLAEQNGLTPDEFRSFVFWCFAHPRTPEDIRKDPRPSIEIWKEARRREEARSRAIRYLAQQYALTEAGFCDFVAFCERERLAVSETSYYHWLSRTE